MGKVKRENPVLVEEHFRVMAEEGGAQTANLLEEIRQILPFLLVVALSEGQRPGS